MQVIIPAGYNQDFPVLRKPQAFLRMGGKELFETTLNKLKEHEVIIVTPFPEEFKEYDVQVLKDDSSGSAASLRSIEKLVEGRFVVHYADTFTPFRIEPLLNFHERMKPLITMGLHASPNPWRYGVVSMDPSGRVVRFLYNPRPDLVFSNLISAGIFVLELGVFDKIPYKMEMQELVTYLVQRQMPVYGYEFKTYWYHLGSVQEYVEANVDYLRRRMEMTKVNVTGVNMYPPVCLKNVHGDAAFVGPNVSAEDVHLGLGSKVRNSVIYPGVKIGDNVNISDSIIGPNVKIEKNSIVTESLIGEDSYVGPNVKVGRSTVGIAKEIMENIFEIKII